MGGDTFKTVTVTVLTENYIGKFMLSGGNIKEDQASVSFINYQSKGDFKEHYDLVFDGGNWNLDVYFYGDYDEKKPTKMDYYNRGVWLSGEKNGKKIKQTLLENGQSEWNGYHTEFIGDLDNDGKPDLVLFHQGKVMPSKIIFLSSLAREDELLGKYGNIPFTDRYGC